MKKPLVILCTALLLCSCASSEVRSDKALSEGMTLMDKGQYQKAQTVFDRALKTDGKNAKLLYDKAIALFSQRKFEEGRSLCEYGFSLHPGNLRFLKLEADSFKEEGKQGQVLSLYDRILALNPGDTNFRLSVMQYAYENGYPDAAKKQALWFISYNMELQKAYAMLGMINGKDSVEQMISDYLEKHPVTKAT